MAAGLPRQDHVYKTTDELFRFHHKNFDEMRCKLDYTENPVCSKNTQPHLKDFQCSKKIRELMKAIDT